MKKFIKTVLSFLLAFVFALSSVSCTWSGGNTEETDDRDETGGSTDQNKNDNDKNENPEFDENGFRVFPEGNYISDPMFDTDDPLPDYDAPLSFAQMGNTSGNSICESEEGWYSDIYDNNVGKSKGLLIYTDKKTGMALPLCGKPECMHDNGSCNAYLGHTFRLQMYDGKLYSIGQSSFRMEPDGTKRESIDGVSWDILDRISNNTFMQLHRGYIYCSSSDILVEGAKEVGYAFVAAQPLDGGEPFTIFEHYYYDEAGMPTVQVRLIGNEMYIMVEHMGDAIKENDYKYCYYADLYRWNIKTRQGETLWKGEYPHPGRMRPIQFDCMPVIGDGIYIGVEYLGWQTIGVNAEPPVCVTRYGVVKYSFKTKKIEEVVWFHEDPGDYVSEDYNIDGYIYFGADRIIFEDYSKKGEWKLFTYGFGGKKIGEYDVYGGNFAGASDEYMYHWHLSSPFAEEYDPSYYYAIPFDGGDIIKIGLIG